MSNKNFIDHVIIYCKSGNGGKGSTHFRREKFIAKGGPDGGDGGRGGHVIAKGNKSLWTLLPLRYCKHVKAEHGGDGSKSRSYGSDGKDFIIECPLGSIIRNKESGKIIGEINEHSQELIILEGGIGGLGNVHFKSATNQAPKYAQPGKSGQEMSIVVELKIMADVGLVGFPNSGKSTLLSVVSAAKPKIDNYPFTTLQPNLGVVPIYEYQSFIMADIPGIIEGASEGKGLGIRFLRHIERNQLLLFLVAADSSNCFKKYHILLRELKKHSPELLDKQRIISISKSDLINEAQKQEIKKQFSGKKVIFFSSLTQKGIEELKNEIWKILNKKD